MKQSQREVTAIKRQVADLSERMDDAYKIIHQQQLFLEALDDKDRKLNIILTGASESADELGSTVEEKISRVRSGSEDKQMGDTSTRKTEREEHEAYPHHHERSGSARQYCTRREKPEECDPDTVKSIHKKRRTSNCQESECTPKEERKKGKRKIRKCWSKQNMTGKLSYTVARWSSD